jgi:hypothetical protein
MRRRSRVSAKTANGLEMLKAMEEADAESA